MRATKTIKLKAAWLATALAITGLILGPITPVADAAPASINRISLDTGGGNSNNHSAPSDISDDGRYVVFGSTASDLVAGDTNAKEDVFIFDRVAGTTERVSVDSSGNQANDNSNGAMMSGDGRYVVFYSGATNLVAGDTNAKTDIFLRDRVAGTTERVSVDSSGNQANESTIHADISDDGRFVLLQSGATNLVAGDTNGFLDIFVRDRLKNETKRISVDSIGNQANNDSWISSISCDGRYIVYNSPATNLVAGDTNGQTDTFLYDSLGGVVTNISSAGNGQTTSNKGSVSCNADRILVTAYATNLISGDTNGQPDLLVYSKKNGTYERASLADDESELNGPANGGTISADGRYVAFDSPGTNLISGDTNSANDVFIRDLTGGTTTRLSERVNGTQGNGGSYWGMLSKDGAYLTFGSDATNLVTGDTNAKTDVFLVGTGIAPISCY